MTSKPPVGRECALSVSKTFGEVDVTLFGGLVGDAHPIHFDATWAASQVVGARIVQGALLLGLASPAMSRFCAEHAIDAMSIGFDRVRFVKPVYFGDTVTCHFWIDNVDGSRLRGRAEFVSQHGEIVCVASPVLAISPAPPSTTASAHE